MILRRAVALVTALALSVLPVIPGASVAAPPAPRHIAPTPLETFRNLFLNELNALAQRVKAGARDEQVYDFSLFQVVKPGATANLVAFPTDYTDRQGDVHETLLVGVLNRAAPDGSTEYYLWFSIRQRSGEAVYVMMGARPPSAGGSEFFVKETGRARERTAGVYEVIADASAIEYGLQAALAEVIALIHIIFGLLDSAGETFLCKYQVIGITVTGENAYYQGGCPPMDKPDLLITHMAAPASAHAGSTFSATVTTGNNGFSLAAASATRFCIARNQGAMGFDDCVELGDLAIPALAGGAYYSGTITLTIPAEVGLGNYYLFASADADRVVHESRETNNSASAVIQVNAHYQGGFPPLDAPDLIAHMAAPAVVDAGDTFPTLVTIGNNAFGPAGASTARLCLAPFARTGEIGDDCVWLRDLAIPALAGGAIYETGPLLKIPAATGPGIYRLVAVADTNGTIAESRETNNIHFAEIIVGAP